MPPIDWIAKSTIVVVPPQAAARVPVSNVSMAKVPPKGISMWVWPSTPPGMTYLPDASITVSAVQPWPVPSATTVSSSTRTSTGSSSAAVMTSPPVMSVLTG